MVGGHLLFKTDVMFGGTNWKVKKMSSQTKGLLERLPSEYFGTNVFVGASAMSKPEIRRRYANGLDALMWGTDYPHPEGTWPQHRQALATDFRPVPVEETRLLLGLNTVRCYDLDLDALSAIAAEIGPTPTPLNQDLDRRTPPGGARGPLLVRRLRHRVEGLRVGEPIRTPTRRRRCKLDGGGRRRDRRGGQHRAGHRRRAAAPGHDRGDRRRRGRRRRADAVADLLPLGKVSGHPVDITDEDAVADLADAVFGAHGAVHLLFNNAGVPRAAAASPGSRSRTTGAGASASTCSVPPSACRRSCPA